MVRRAYGCVDSVQGDSGCSRGEANSLDVGLSAASVRSRDNQAKAGLCCLLRCYGGLSDMTWHQLFGRLFHPSAYPLTLHSFPGVIWDIWKLVIPYVMLAIIVLEILSNIAASISPRYRAWQRAERSEQLEELMKS